MAEPWYDPNWYGWIPGASLGVVGGLWGTFAGLIGRHRPALVTGSLWLWLAGSVVLLATAVYALVQGQPYGVWYGLGLPGLLGTCMGIFFLFTIRPVLLRAQREEEERRMQARDLG
jgi:hypothetical protein